MKNYYEILGLNKQATKDEIRKAYRKLSVKFHPDKNDGEAFFADMFKNINEAHEVLIDDKKREIYDSDFRKYVNRENSTDEKERIRRQWDEVRRVKVEQENKERQIKEVLDKIGKEQVIAQEKVKNDPALTRKVGVVPKALSERRVSEWDKTRRWKTIRNVIIFLNIILLTYIIIGPKKLHFFRPQGTNAFIVARNGLYLREEPSSQSRAIASLPVYTYVTLLKDDGPMEKISGKSNPWYQVKHDSINGWLWGGYVEKVNK